MKSKIGSVVLISLGILLAGCGKETEEIGEETVTTVEESVAANLTEDDTEDLAESQEAEELETVSTIIEIENPSWDYYIEGEEVSVTSPLKLVQLTEEANEITDTEKWFAENDLSLTEMGDERYFCEINSPYDSEERSIQVTDRESGESFTVDLEGFRYADDFSEADESFVEQIIRYAKAENGVLYFSIGHLTYAGFSPHNAYVAAVDLTEKKLLWKSEPLVSNANNFVISGDVLLCGYGFTSEPDYLYQLDLTSGKVIEEIPLKSMADYLILKDNILYVRTYNTDYTFQVE